MTNQDDKTHRIHPTIRQRARELRRPLTPPEYRLWRILRGRRLAGYKFRRQHPIGRFIVDFYCPVARLIIELDGPSHNEQQEYDAERTAWLEAQDYHIVRFSNQQVIQEEGAVARVILQLCHNYTLSPNPSPSEREGNTGRFLAPSEGEGNAGRFLAPSPSEGEGWGGGVP